MAKAKAECTCKKCGNTFIVTAYRRNTTEAASFVAWAVENITECKECETAEKKAEMDKVKDGIPAQLTGSEKQIAWAEDIRAKLVSASRAYANSRKEDAEQAMAYVEWVVENKTDSRFWIDNRSLSHLFMCRAAATEWLASKNMEV